MQFQNLNIFEDFVAHGAAQIDIAGMVRRCFCAARLIFHENAIVVVVVVHLAELVIQAEIDSEIFDILANRIHSTVLFVFVGKQCTDIAVVEMTVVDGFRVDHILTDRIELSTIVEA